MEGAPTWGGYPCGVAGCGTAIRLAISRRSGAAARRTDGTHPVGRRRWRTVAV